MWLNIKKKKKSVKEVEVTCRLRYANAQDGTEVDSSRTDRDTQLMHSAEHTHTVAGAHFNTHKYEIITHTRMQTTYTSHRNALTICTVKYHETLSTKKRGSVSLQIGSLGQREHLELISFRFCDKSLVADFTLTIQTLLMHRKHICLLPIPGVNNQQVRWGCVSPTPSSLQ